MLCLAPFFGCVTAAHQRPAGRSLLSSEQGLVAPCREEPSEQMGQESALLSVGLEDELIMQPVGWHTSLQPPLPVAGVQKSRGKRCLAG